MHVLINHIKLERRLLFIIYLILLNANLQHIPEQNKYDRISTKFNFSINFVVCHYDKECQSSYSLQGYSMW